ncbi:MAG TPA: hypothetical protein VLZ50_05920 [Terracidiphilus sp.]|nr:hypothetical protein [Terracidiphilus sp.]
MKCSWTTNLRGPLLVWALVGAAASAPAQPAPEATVAFDSYIASVESRLAEQHRSSEEFLAPADPARLRKGEMVVEPVSTATGTGLSEVAPPGAPPGASIHHWRGTAFAPGATAAEFEPLLRDFDGYPERFTPQVVAARVLARQGDRTRIWMRVRQRHGLTVILETTYDVTFGKLDSTHGSSTSRSVEIAQVEPAGRAFDGLLWRQNIYWRWEERDGGLEIQIESVSLTRSIPRGLGWAIGPFVESVPREELEFTLHSVCNALRRANQ